MSRTLPLLLLSITLTGCGALGDLLEERKTGDEEHEEEVDTCTDLVNGGEEVPETAGFVFFEPTGGVVADGTYHLTKFDIFAPGSVDPYLRRHALRVTGDKVEVVTQKTGEPELRRTASMSTEGNVVTFTVDCPSFEVITFNYTASENMFTHVIEAEGIKEVHTYTKQ